MSSDALLVPLFAATLTLGAGVAFYYFYQALQRNWSIKAHEFRAEKAPTVRLMKQAAQEHEQAVQLLYKLEERQDRLEYQLAILGDLTEVVARFADRAPLDPDEFRSFLGKVVLAGTQALIPDQTDVRARLLIFNGDVIAPYADYVPRGAKPFRGRVFRPDEGAVGLAYSSAQAVIVADALVDPLFQGEPTPQYRSVLCVPVPARRYRPIGVLNLDSTQPDEFSDEDARTLSYVANLVHVLWVIQHGLVTKVR